MMSSDYPDLTTSSDMHCSDFDAALIVQPKFNSDPSTTELSKAQPMTE